MFAASFLSQKSYREITLVFVNHLTEDSARAEDFLKSCASDKLNLPLLTYKIQPAKPKGDSWEEYWRNERYKIFHDLDAPVVTGHHLNDCMETWLFTCMNGSPKVIPYRNRNVIRPFLTTPKERLVQWCDHVGVEWIEDQSNKDTKHARNRIRHVILPEVLKINPGLHRVVARKVAAQSLTTQDQEAT